MSFRSRLKLRVFSATTFAAIAALHGGLAVAAETQVAQADQAAQAGQTAQAGQVAEANGPIETIVVTGTKFNVDLAPAKASIQTMEPQTIINRDYMENFVSPMADYVTVLAIAPGMTGQTINGPGASDGGVKNTLRGLPDGSFGMSYDGIPFGDTNGPSHHSLSYFPASTIGAIDVDRGPGNAGTLGAATFGGTIRLFSEPLTDQRHLKVALSYGSYGTRSEVANFQTGDFADGTHVMGNIQNNHTDGRLAFMSVDATYLELKADHKFGDNWVLTLFGSYNHLAQYVADNNSATPAQVAVYGLRYALQKSNPAASNYIGFNWQRKETDMDYARLQGNISDTLKLDNMIYTYSYSNHTFAAANTSQTLADIQANTFEGLGTTVGGVKRPTGINGYTKLNAFRVQGDIFRLTDDFEIGGMPVQARPGIWLESAVTPRQRYYYDVGLCNQLNIDPWANPPNLAACQNTQQKGVFLQPGDPTPKDIGGNTTYTEHTSWYQYQPFLELELHPLENLTVTPGVKYIDWLHKTDSRVETGILKPLKAEFTTVRWLPFLEANYKFMPNWSVYAQYAQGIYVPDIGTFENSAPVDTFPRAQTTTNYQVGTVFYADNFTFDGDLYLIKVKNNYTTQDCGTLGGLKGDLCYVNTGNATYKGIEGEATYAFQGALEGFSVFANGALMSSKTSGLWIKQAPKWTLAAGVLYKHDGWKFSVIDKSIGPQFSDNAQNPLYEIKAYSTMDATAGYTYGPWEISLSANNLLDKHSILSITENDKVYQTNRMNSLDTYLFQPGLTYMATIKLRY